MPHLCACPAASAAPPSLVRLEHVAVRDERRAGDEAGPDGGGALVDVVGVVGKGGRHRDARVQHLIVLLHRIRQAPRAVSWGDDRQPHAHNKALVQKPVLPSQRRVNKRVYTPPRPPASPPRCPLASAHEPRGSARPPQQCAGARWQHTAPHTPCLPAAAPPTWKGRLAYCTSMPASTSSCGICTTDLSLRPPPLPRMTTLRLRASSSSLCASISPKIVL